jgi:5'-methylthioadenosine phosphorylase
LVDETAEIGVIGGTGVYDTAMLEEGREVKVHTPYGRTSDLITVGRYKGRRVAFLPRHGRGHQIPPHRIPFRANIYAFKKLGVQRIIAPSAVGSLREDFEPSQFAVIDQFIDRTKWRGDTFYEEGQVCHISTADPFCPELRALFVDTTQDLAIPVHGQGTYVCIQGPRFSTRAESRLFRSWGADVVGMTLYPEVALAREMEMCYASLAMITDYDVWADKPVTVEEIIRTVALNVKNLRTVITTALPKIPAKRTCACKDALHDALL